MARGTCAIFGLVVVLAAQTALGEAGLWARFLGADGSGHCQETGLPLQWDADDVAWRTDLDGQGHSSPCLWGERIFLTAARKTDSGQVERITFCLDRNDGRVVWQHAASTGDGESLHKMNSFATPTCACDGQRVVAFFGRGGLHCYDMDGKPLWSRDLGTFPGPWGTGASPVILGDLVIQNCDAEGESSLIAFDKATGETLWQTDRGERPRGGWSTPFVLDTGDRQELILNGEFGVRAYDPATGEEFWFCRSFNGRGTPVPARGHGLLYVICGKSGDVYAVRPGGQGDVTDTHMIWHTPRTGGRDLASPALVGNHMIVVNMAGVGTCYDVTTGKELWKERLEGAFSASPVVIDGNVYIQNEAGQTLVIRPGDKLDLLASNDLNPEPGEIFRGTMAPSDGQLFFRSDQAVYCVGKRTSGE